MSPPEFEPQPQPGPQVKILKLTEEREQWENEAAAALARAKEAHEVELHGAVSSGISAASEVSDGCGVALTQDTIVCSGERSCRVEVDGGA